MWVYFHDFVLNKEPPGPNSMNSNQNTLKWPIWEILESGAPEIEFWQHANFTFGMTFGPRNGLWTTFGTTLTDPRWPEPPKWIAYREWLLDRFPPRMPQILNFPSFPALANLSRFRPRPGPGTPRWTPWTPEWHPMPWPDPTPMTIPGPG